jgi:hypothetical protein
VLTHKHCLLSSACISFIRVWQHGAITSLNSISHLFITKLFIHITYMKFVVNDSHCISLTLILLTWTIWRAPTNASKWRMGFNSAFKGLTLILLTWTIWRAPTNASKWRMGFNSAFKGVILLHNEQVSNASLSKSDLHFLLLHKVCGKKFAVYWMWLNLVW